MMRKKKEKQRQLKVVNKEIKPKRKNNNSSVSNGFYYSFLTIILLLCLIQIAISAVYNISKIISYKAKIIQITNTRNAAQALNEQLHDNIKNFSNVTGLEAIARNNLKMSGEDEVLVIITTKEEEENKKVEKKDSMTEFIKLKKHD